MSEVKILRDENARLIRQQMTDQKEIAQLKSMVVDRNLQVQDISIKYNDLLNQVQELQRILRFYDNPHTPPSRRGIAKPKPKPDTTAQKPEPDTAPKPKPEPDTPPPKRHGPKPGHAGASHRRKADRTEHHAARQCSRCGSTSLAPHAIKTKQITDFASMPKIETVNHVIHSGRCGCGHTEEPSVGIRGTEMGRNVGTVAASLWKNGNSMRSTACILAVLGSPFTPGAVQNAMDRMADSLEDEYTEIKKGLASSSFLKFDETPYTMGNRQGYVWCAVGDDSVVYHADWTRSAIVLDIHFPYYDTPTTADGFPGYIRFKILQRCWAHILRESKDAAEDAMLADLHGRLSALYREAVEASRLPDAASHCTDLTSRCLAIVEAYKERGCKFGEKLERATPNLFTFLKHPGMHPTNNETERMIRKPVIHRKIRFRMVNGSGMRMFNILMTCLFTWEKRGLDLVKRLAELL